MENIIYTIGHSTRDINTFIELLQAFKIALLADVRSYPGSRKYPHFNKENLQSKLKDSGINYEHFPALGGRRKPVAESNNNAWR
ncbi:MAG: DUF488 domain-containing protein, partial [Segetibacter sp.]|nr:DUF488 domain-containing protein [Segetibacter sp.]